jgi:carbonic anhydrase
VDFAPAHRLFELGGSARRKGALLIVCSDLKINPHQLIPTNLADLYVGQSLGNNVVPGGGGPSSDFGSIEQMVALYGPTDIVICGHTPCGVLDLLGTSGNDEMPSVAGFLRHASRAQTIVERHYAAIKDQEDRRDVLARENVLVQLENLRTIPTVALALDRGDLHLHGWMHRNGAVYTYDVHQEQFVPLAQ